jgi:hypothetical protein
MRCHSVCSFFSPSFDVQFSVVAMLKLATDWPPGVTANLGVLAQVADQDYFVHTAHVTSPLLTYSSCCARIRSLWDIDYLTPA